MTDKQPSPRETEARSIGAVIAEMRDVAAIRTWLRRAHGASGLAFHPQR